MPDRPKGMEWPAPPEQPTSEATSELNDGLGAVETIYEQAVRIARAEGKVSASLLQRRMMIGYGRAQRLIEKMQRDGIIGEYRGEGRPYLVLSA